MVNNASGFNPMRWNCEKRGCYNIKHRPKIEVFHDIWPGKISMSDVDAIVEVSGNFLLLEWKSVAKELPTGQRIMYERMTQGARFTVLVVTGDAETMCVSSVSLFYNATRYPKPPRQHWGTDMDGLRKIMSRWCAHAVKNPKIGKV
jgi:hypothetical protein